MGKRTTNKPFPPSPPLVLRHSCSEFFSSSQFFHLLTILATSIIFHRVVRNQVSLGYPNHSPHIRTYRGILRMYLWYSKKKGVNVSNPQHKNTVSDQFCVATIGGHFGQICRHLAVAATCFQHVGIFPSQLYALQQINDCKYIHFLCWSFQWPFGSGGTMPSTLPNEPGPWLH